MKNKFNSLLDGFASIGREMASIFGGGTDLRDDPEIKRILERTDAEALAGDWDAVIGDLKVATDTLYCNLHHE